MARAWRRRARLGDKLLNWAPSLLALPLLTAALLATPAVTLAQSDVQLIAEITAVSENEGRRGLLT